MRIPILAAALLVCGAATAQAQSPRETVLVQLDGAAGTARGDGYSSDTRPLGGSASLLGMMGASGHVAVEVMLESGTEYFISAVCDTDCEDLDLRAVSLNGQELDEDVAEDDAPIVHFTATQSGPHLLEVMMPSCSTRLCYFGVRVLSKR